jgi:hypothetical protein
MKRGYRQVRSQCTASWSAHRPATTAVIVPLAQARHRASTIANNTRRISSILSVHLIYGK